MLKLTKEMYDPADFEEGVNFSKKPIDKLILV